MNRFCHTCSSFTTGAKEYTINEAKYFFCKEECYRSYDLKLTKMRSMV